MAVEIENLHFLNAKAQGPLSTAPRIEMSISSLVMPAFLKPASSFSVDSG